MNPPRKRAEARAEAARVADRTAAAETFLQDVLGVGPVGRAEDDAVAWIRANSALVLSALAERARRIQFDAEHGFGVWVDTSAETATARYVEVRSSAMILAEILDRMGVEIAPAWMRETLR